MPFTADLEAALCGADWRVSSFSGDQGQCVAVARLVDWRVSSYSGDQGACVAVAQLDESVIALRNSNHPDAGTLVCSPGEWSAFAMGVAGGQLDDLRA